jgi:hypothetical protein
MARMGLGIEFSFERRRSRRNAARNHANLSRQNRSGMAENMGVRRALAKALQFPI